MTRFARPGWRLAGSFAGWVVFAFRFLSLYQVAAVVSGLGGFCASGGPYVIETECPQSVVVLAPLSVFGLFIGAGIAAFFARGFGVPLLVWGWPILFVGLGVQFGLTGVRGDVTGIILALVFIGMGLVPLVFALRADPVRSFVGSRNFAGDAFVGPDVVRRTFPGMGYAEPGEPVPVTAGDVAASAGVFLIAVAVGTWLSFSAFQALAAAG